MTIINEERFKRRLVIGPTNGAGQDATPGPDHGSDKPSTTEMISQMSDQAPDDLTPMQRRKLQREQAEQSNQVNQSHHENEEDEKTADKIFDALPPYYKVRVAKAMRETNGSMTAALVLAGERDEDTRLSIILAIGGTASLLGGVKTGEWLDNQEFPDVVCHVEGLLYEGYTLLVGPPKIGKSWLVLQILLAMATGTQAFGSAVGGGLKTTRGKVLYLALEDGDRRMQSRLRKLLDGEEFPANFYYATEVKPGRLRETIEEFLEEHPDTVAVAIDTLVRQ